MRSMSSSERKYDADHLDFDAIVRSDNDDSKLCHIDGYELQRHETKQMMNGIESDSDEDIVSDYTTNKSFDGDYCGVGAHSIGKDDTKRRLVEAEQRNDNKGFIDLMEEIESGLARESAESIYDRIDDETTSIFPYCASDSLEEKKDDDSVITPLMEDECIDDSFSKLLFISTNQEEKEVVVHGSIPPIGSASCRMPSCGEDVSNGSSHQRDSSHIPILANDTPTAEPQRVDNRNYEPEDKSDGNSSKSSSLIGLFHIMTSLSNADYDVEQQHLLNGIPTYVSVATQLTDDEDCCSIYSIESNTFTRSHIKQAGSEAPFSIETFCSPMHSMHSESITGCIGPSLSLVSASEILVKETQPLGGPKYYIATNTKMGQARVIHEAMPSESYHTDNTHAVPEEMGYEIIEYALVRGEMDEEEGTPPGYLICGLMQCTAAYNEDTLPMEACADENARVDETETVFAHYSSTYDAEANGFATGERRAPEDLEESIQYDQATKAYESILENIALAKNGMATALDSTSEEGTAKDDIRLHEYNNDEAFLAYNDNFTTEANSSSIEEIRSSGALFTVDLGSTSMKETTKLDNGNKIIVRCAETPEAYVSISVELPKNSLLNDDSCLAGKNTFDDASLDISIFEDIARQESCATNDTTNEDTTLVSSDDSDSSGTIESSAPSSSDDDTITTREGSYNNVISAVISYATSLEGSEEVRSSSSESSLFEEDTTERVYRTIEL